MHNKELQIFQQVGITKSGNYNYSEIANSFLSDGYISLAGNTYFNSIWFVNGLAILADIGQGHTWSFLNGLKIINLNDKKLVYDGRFHCRRYNKVTMINTVTQQIVNTITDSAKRKGISINEVEIYLKIQTIIQDGFKKDQRYMLKYNSQKFLSA